MKFKGLGLAVVGLIVFYSVWARAGNINDHASSADVIVVGTVLTRFEGPTGVSFDLNVEKVLKGNVAGQSVHVAHSWERTGIVIGDAPRQIAARIRGIWCLRHTASSDWDVLVVRSLPGGSMGSIYWPMAATLPMEYQYPAGAPLLDTLTFELAAGHESGGDPSEMVGATGPVNTPALQTVFAHLLGSQKVAFQAAGLAGMLHGGQKGAIQQLAKLWATISSDRMSSYVVMTLRSGFRDPAPDSVQQLAQLADANTTSSELRKAAVWALATIHTKESLPFLASLLLSSDTYERGRGVFGLSSFANGCPSQTSDSVRTMDYLQFKPTPYRNAETEANFAIPGPNVSPGDPRLAELVSFWSAWWKQHPELH
jgi:hypothetical protein